MVTAEQPTLQVRGLVKHFPLKGSTDVVQAANGVSFKIARGETLGLVGESGSGKTTVGRCILRVIEPTAGKVVFQGEDLTELDRARMRPFRAKIQMVFQEPHEALNPRMTVEQIITDPLLMLRHLPKSQRAQRVREVLELTGLPQTILDEYPHQLSGSVAQRVNIARAIATNPALIVHDEPTSSLDVSVRAEIIRLLKTLQEELGISYLFISHDLMAVRHIAHRVAVMYLSRIVEITDAETLFKQPLHPYSAALMSSVLVPDPRHKTREFPLYGEIPSPINLPPGCALYGRCPVAVGACKERVPPLVDVSESDTHRAACVRIPSEPADGWGPRILLDEGPKG